MIAFYWHLRDSKVNDTIEHSAITNTVYVRIVAVYFAGFHLSQCEYIMETWPYLVLTNINGFFFN